MNNNIIYNKPPTVINLMNDFDRLKKQRKEYAKYDIIEGFQNKYNIIPLLLICIILIIKMIV